MTTEYNNLFANVNMLLYCCLAGDEVGGLEWRKPSNVTVRCYGVNEENEMSEPAWVYNGPQYSDDDRSGEVWITRPVPVTGELIHQLDGVVVLHVEVFFSCEGEIQSLEVREVCDDEVWPDDEAVEVDSLTPIETALAWDRAEAP